MTNYQLGFFFFTSLALVALILFGAYACVNFAKNDRQRNAILQVAKVLTYAFVITAVSVSWYMQAYK